MSVVGELKDIFANTRYFNLIVLATFIKVLLIPSYLSTDFEVHRNWLAITSSLPISQWYYENTSEWTLDYPPFFAWFEFVLSKVAYFFDKDMLVVDNLNYKSSQTILFQRLSVIVSDFLFILATLLLSRLLYSKLPYGNSNNNNNRKTSLWYQDKQFLVSCVVILNPGLLMVDHIHFQYNGFLKGILILSIYFICRGNILIGSMLFSVLLNFKHIYMYMAPAFFIYLLKYYCFDLPRNSETQSSSLISLFNVSNFIKLGFVVLFVFVLSLGPFIVMAQIPQLLSRLFPFGRGLSHAYWAPNFWSLYNFADRLALFLGLVSKDNIKYTGNLTSGLVGSESQSHVILPQITPPITLLITIVFLIPSLYGIFKKKDNQSFLIGITQSCFTFFMFGWHVHEKAIIMITIPLGFVCLFTSTPKYSKIYFLLSTIGHYSLFPLLFKATEIPIRILVLVTYTLMIQFFIQQNNPSKFRWFEKLYLFGLIPLEIFNIIIHPIYLAHIEKFSFVSLMLTSVYCAIGIHYCYLYMYSIIFSSSPNHNTNNKKKNN
ncbi:hypothetical protein CYY_004081 [Polysphondylium violaceum]|uniref:Alpha-1,3-glucosyltransferase n=1 Tax=Polysphondylium violaceum TaxID=133409 RepID=A0A8J4UT95_9MYCE|nr:hypothetical protein CYY_004081 [Polysphondylium violaceum]